MFKKQPLRWQLGLILILAFGIPRFVLVLQANATGNFSFLSVIFILMLFTPYILLTSDDRRQSGMKRPSNFLWLFGSAIIGVLAGFAMYTLGSWLYNDSIYNWFVYIAQSYELNTGPIQPNDKLVYFIIFSIVGMTFSPLGEELLYRGVIHASFEDRFGDNLASVLDSAAFGVTHLAHFGIIYYTGKWQFALWPSLIWIFLIFCSGLLFNYCKRKTGSIFGAILCHAFFNLSMTYFIFYHIL